MTTTPEPSSSASVSATPSRSSAILPSILLGVGLGGLIDGIVLHQILQWHHLLSHEESVDTVLGLERNTLADGLFHAVAWAAVVVGVVLLWMRLSRDRTVPPLRMLFGGMLFGWGLFDVVEGLVNHQILGLHHVRDDLGGPLSWDVGFLAFGALLMLLGWLLVRRPESAPQR